MAITNSQIDKNIEAHLFADADIDLYSAAQVTDIVAAYFIKWANVDALIYL